MLSSKSATDQLAYSCPVCKRRLTERLHIQARQAACTGEERHQCWTHGTWCVPPSPSQTNGHAPQRSWTTDTHNSPLLLNTSTSLKCRQIMANADAIQDSLHTRIGCQEVIHCRWRPVKWVTDKWPILTIFIHSSAAYYFGHKWLQTCTTAAYKCCKNLLETVGSTDLINTQCQRDAYEKNNGRLWLQ